MSDKVTVQLAPMSIVPLKKKSLLETIWEAIGGYVLFFGGVAVGWILAGLGQ